jgi:hypothetical protein
MSMVQEARQAGRTLRQRPLFALVACFSLAIGTGGAALRCSAS